MFDSLFGEGQYALKMLLAFIVVFGLLALALWLVRRFGGERLSTGAARGRQPRLAVIDAATVDSRRRLVLIRRDNVEHLLMIGGPTDVVIEPNIVRAAAAPREMPAARPVPAGDTLPRQVPLGEGNMWPLQPEPTSRSEPSRTDRPEPPQRAEPPPRLPRPPSPAVEETAQGSNPGPEFAPLPPPTSRERRPRNEPLSGLAEDLGRLPRAPEPAHFEPPARPAPRREARARPLPMPPAVVPPVPAPDTKFSSPADQSLAEMAHRLEAALRRPAKSEEAAPPPPPPKAEPSREEIDEPTPPPQASVPVSRPPAPTDSATPPRNDGRPAKSDAKPPQQKSLYDSLEQEMASLLGRPGGKN